MKLKHIRPPRKSAIKRRWLWLTLLAVVWLVCSGQAFAAMPAPGEAAGGLEGGGAIATRLSQFPNWIDQPAVVAAEGDLAYPDWFEGQWRLETTLVERVAPLAPEVQTPGFEGNAQYLNQPITATVQFVPSHPSFSRRFVQSVILQPTQVVSDRAFNGLNLARAYLGAAAVKAVKVDPVNPNRQVTLLRGSRQLESTVTGRAVETPSPNDFLTTELFQQVFRGAPQPYFNRVETTSAYHYHPGDIPTITADQVTAIYLSPQDPDYFQVMDQPVALYRYQLSFFPGALESTQLPQENGL